MEALAFYNRGSVWHQKKELERAIADYSEAIRIDPKLAPAYYSRGIAWRQKKDFEHAIVNYGEAVQVAPNHAESYNARAWLWATCPDERFRDGKKAVESATKACELNGWKETLNIDCLAAAYAEAGDFDQAVKWQQEAIKRETTDSPLVKEYQEHLALYRDKKPYHQP